MDMNRQGMIRRAGGWTAGRALWLGLAVASASFVIVNGIGYDPWAGRLLSANPVPGRGVLDVGTLVGVPVGGNPHRWYSPPDVQRVIDAVTARYRKLDPNGAAYFDAQRSSLETKGLAAVYRLTDGNRVLRLTEFATSNGPDVHVYLVAAGDVQDNATVKRAGFVDLGSIKGNVGDQNYDVPADVVAIIGSLDIVLGEIDR